MILLSFYISKVEKSRRNQEIHFKEVFIELKKKNILKS